MKKSSVESIVSALNQAGVRYLIVGGLAVNAHGYMRLTVDIDLLVQLDETNARAAIEALQRLGYRPRVPVAFAQFADVRVRQEWLTQRNMQVFSVFSPEHPETEIDLFVSDPLGFDQAYAITSSTIVRPWLAAVVCSLADLLKLKRLANRPKDALDIAELRQIHGEV